LYDQIKNNETGWTCSTYDRHKKLTEGFELRLEGNRPLEDLGLDGRKRLKRIFKQWDGESWTRLIGLGIGTGGGSL